MSIEVLIRPYKEFDKGFVMATWLKSYKFSSPFAKRIRHDIYFPAHAEIVKRLILESQIIVACLNDDQDVILGYLCFDHLLEGPDTIHYIFVKEEWRKNGVAKTLMIKSKITHAFFTHWTEPMNSLINKDFELTYDPYRLFKGET